MATLTLDAFRKILAEQLAVREADVVETADLADDLGAQSVDLVMVISSVEEHLGVEFVDLDFTDMRTVGDAYALLNRHLAE